MSKGMDAAAEITINASAERVWEALTTPEIIKQYFFGADVATEWKVGSPIYLRGTWEGKPIEDRGVVVECSTRRRLVVTHWSPLSGVADVPENHHTVTYDLGARDGGTVLKISQDNNSSEEEAAHSTQNWRMILEALKRLLEAR